jgi:cytochrome c biogenesis protein
MKRFLSLWSSLRLAIILLILLAAACVLGTLIPQKWPAEGYAARYASFAPLLLRFQFDDVFHSAWFLGLLGIFASNIIVCTLTRLAPKIRRALRPRLEVEPKSLAAFKIGDRFKMKASAASVQTEVEKVLAGARYRVRRTSRDGAVHILARKRVLGLFGSDAVHLGLLVIIAGGLVSGLAGFRENLSLVKGRELAVPRSEAKLRLDEFTTEYYPGGAVKDWTSSVTLLEQGRPVLSNTIEVNRPLSYKGLSFYQAAYGWNWEKMSVEIRVRKKSDSAFLKELMIPVGGRKDLEDAEGTAIAVTRFFPDFVLNAGNEPGTRSDEPNNPAALVEAYRRGEKIASGWVFANYPDFAPARGAADSGWLFELKRFDAEPISIIEAVHDPGALFIWIGCALVMAGLGLAFYWPLREIRLVLLETGGQTELIAGGAATKNRERFVSEFDRIAAAIRRSR